MSVNCGNKIEFSFGANKAGFTKTVTFSLLIFNTLNVQWTEDILKLLDPKNNNVVIIPVNFTNQLQPLDLSINKTATEFLQYIFQEWYETQVQYQLQSKGKEEVDLKLSVTYETIWCQLDG